MTADEARALTKQGIATQSETIKPEIADEVARVEQAIAVAASRGLSKVMASFRDEASYLLREAVLNHFLSQGFRMYHRIAQSGDPIYFLEW